MSNGNAKHRKRTQIRNAAVIGKRTTVVHAKGNRNPLFKCVTVAKVGQGRPKSKDCGGSLTPAIQYAKYERSGSSRRYTGTGKPKSRPRHSDLFAKVNVIFVRSCRAVWRCIVSETLKPCRGRQLFQKEKSRPC